MSNMEMLSRGASKTERSRWPALATTMYSPAITKGKPKPMTMGQKVDRWYVQCCVVATEGLAGMRADRLGVARGRPAACAGKRAESEDFARPSRGRLVPWKMEFLRARFFLRTVR